VTDRETSVDLVTRYLGLELENPLIASADLTLTGAAVEQRYFEVVITTSAPTSRFPRRRSAGSRSRPTSGSAPAAASVWAMWRWNAWPSFPSVRTCRPGRSGK